MRLPARKRDRPVIRAILHVVGAVAFVIGVWQTNRTIGFVHRAVHTTGYVVARQGEPTATESGAHPNVSFTDQTGAAVRYNQNGMGSRRVGTPLPVLYDPAAPAATAGVNAFWQIWGTALFSLWIGVGFTVGALWGDVYSNWDRYLASKPETTPRG